VATQDESTSELIPEIETADLWDPDVAQAFLPRVLRLNSDQRTALVKKLAEILSAQHNTSEAARWNAALVVEFLVQWDPLKIPAELLLTMTNDPFFSVRSSAAVCYYRQRRRAPSSTSQRVTGCTPITTCWSSVGRAAVKVSACAGSMSTWTRR
jgi:hypothetical protein